MSQILQPGLHSDHFTQILETLPNIQNLIPNIQNLNELLKRSFL